VFALVSMLLTGPVVDWLVSHRNNGIIDAERVKAVLMAAGFVLLFGSFIAGRNDLRRGNATGDRPGLGEG